MKIWSWTRTRLKSLSVRFGRSVIASPTGECKVVKHLIFATTVGRISGTNGTRLASCHEADRRTAHRADACGRLAKRDAVSAKDVSAEQLIGVPHNKSPALRGVTNGKLADALVV
jgi:hypothetical protein